MQFLIEKSLICLKDNAPRRDREFVSRELCEMDLIFKRDFSFQ